MRDPDLLAAIGPVAEAFEKLGARYYIGGSIASSAYGAARSTLDVDMVSDLKPQHVRFLANMLESSYYLNEDAILEAIRRHSSFNLIHLFRRHCTQQAELVSHGRGSIRATVE